MSVKAFEAACVSLVWVARKGDEAVDGRTTTCAVANVESVVAALRCPGLRAMLYSSPYSPGAEAPFHFSVI